MMDIDTALNMLLVRVREGQTSFSPETNTAEAINRFQNTASQLTNAEDAGLIYGVFLHKESETGERLIDHVSVKGLTKAGLDAISSVPKILKETAIS